MISYQQIEKTLWIQNLLDVALQEFKEKPSETRLENLIKECKGYLASFNEGHLKLPVYVTSHRSHEWWDD